MMHWNETCSASRLRLLRVMAEETQEETAKSLNISRSCLANYETGRRIPDAEMVTGFADHFRVETSYFLGQTFTGKVSEPEQELMKLIPENGILDLTGISEEGRIALLQFYSFLREKRNIEEAKAKASIC